MRAVIQSFYAFIYSFLRKLYRQGSLSFTQVKIWGNLGDQLFNYALGIHLNTVNPHSKVDFDLSEFTYFKRHKNVADELAHQLKLPTQPERSKLTNILRGLFYFLFFKKKTWSDLTHIPNKRPFNEMWLYLGHVRNEDLFATSREKILKTFDFSYFSNHHRAEERIALHIMPANESTTLNPSVWPAQASVDYYRNALKEFTTQHPHVPIQVFTDHKNWCISFMPETRQMDFAESFSESSIDSLNQLSKCKYQILSPTSFGWWAGWLNNDSEKAIRVPSAELSHPFTVDLKWPVKWSRVSS